MIDRVKLYETLTALIEDYFGPSTPHFVNRLIANHLDKTTHQITTQDLPELFVWIKLIVALLTDDQQLVEAFTKRMTHLSTSSVSYKLS